MVRTNLVLERAAEKAQFKKTKTVLSCAHKDRRVLWRDALQSGLWSQPKKHPYAFVPEQDALVLKDALKEAYHEHLRSKAKKRSGYRLKATDELIRIPYYGPPTEIKFLREAINKSRRILELKDNWDDEGSIGYSESTWRRAESFLMKNAMSLWRSHQKCFGPPKISGGPEGSIDLHWKTDNRELLINVPASSEDPIGYYGDDRAEETTDAVRGKDLESSPDAAWIFLWLTK